MLSKDGQEGFPGNEENGWESKVTQMKLMAQKYTLNSTCAINGENKKETA